MFMVDLMHEFELGIWKAVFMHCIWLLTGLESGTIHELNQRCDIATIVLDTLY